MPRIATTTWSRPNALALALAVATSLVLTGCRKPEYDTSTPEKVLDAMQKMIEDEHPERLPTLLEVKARDVTYADGVTEASAIGDVKGKLGEIFGELWRVSRKLQSRWPDQVKKELNLATAAAAAGATSKQASRDIGDVLSRILADPFSYVTAQRQNLSAQDMSDGTGAISWKGEPLWNGILTMVETKEGWRITFPAELVQGGEYWPKTREEWAVVATFMLGIENSLRDFERELDSGKFRDLRQASERVGRLVGESVVVQSIIYASMKRSPAEKAGAPAR